MSAERFLPMVNELIKSEVVIISARTKYEKVSKSYNEWKIHAFLEAREKLESQALTNLIAIGDNNVELEAAYNLASHYSEAFIKTVKFKAQPTIQILVK